MDALSLTAAEAGYVLDRSPKAINKAVDEGVIRARSERVGKIVQRVLGSAELRFLGVAAELRKNLTHEGQKRFYEALRASPSDVHVIRIGKLELDLTPVDAELTERVARLKALRASVETRNDDVVINGTDVPVHLVAALVRGQTVAEVVEDYPTLTPQQVETASEYAKAFPKRGRPYPTRSFKRMIAAAAALGVFDRDEDAGDIEPFIVR